MSAVLIFGCAMLAAVAISDAADRSVVSTAVLFLFVGLIAGNPGFDVVSPTDHQLFEVAELALFAVLFSDGKHVRIDMGRDWQLPARALAIGLPLTVIVMAVAAVGLTGLGLVPALLLGAVLGPTDPVFAEAIIGRNEIPRRVRHLLNVESGLNDGLALPLVIVLIDVLSDTPIEPWALVAETLGGVALGATAAVLFIALVRLKWTSSSVKYRPLGTVALAIVVFAASDLTGANEFLAAFSAGFVVGHMRPMDEETESVDELIAEVLKLAAVFTFGAALSWSFVSDFGLGEYVFVAVVLFVARPAALALALMGTSLSRNEWLTAAWFGPKGFASVVYSLLVFNAALGDGDEIFHLAGVAVALSIVAHSSTDVLVARSFENSRADTAA